MYEISLAGREWFRCCVCEPRFMSPGILTIWRQSSYTSNQHKKPFSSFIMIITANPLTKSICAFFFFSLVTSPQIPVPVPEQTECEMGANPSATCAEPDMCAFDLRPARPAPRQQFRVVVLSVHAAPKRLCARPCFLFIPSDMSGSRRVETDANASDLYSISYILNYICEEDTEIVCA